MTAFQCIPIATEVANRFRRTRLDDRGNQIRSVIATSSGAFPCRHCLQLARPGETMLLGSYDLPQPLGVYWTPSPIFLHETECPYGEVVNDVAPIVRANPLVSVRAYDVDHLCLYDLGHVSSGNDVDGPLMRALSDPRTEFVNIHTARPGCLLSLVRRIPS
ncbi:MULTISPECIES: DUF1203 domain-containing protein [unclassified Methylobacterium]|uniref:DUF1203 domain-containing protein n=1 Tax=unclassified Methylobacterium TaxID=2615210 RepID=UPI002269B2F1|nr:MULTISPECIES: DUF1203 domain-containing protein [unclassified Methylobacterium]